jgi:hypothetical protein
VVRRGEERKGIPGGLVPIGEHTISPSSEESVLWRECDSVHSGDVLALCDGVSLSEGRGRTGMIKLRERELGRKPVATEHKV